MKQFSKEVDLRSRRAMTEFLAKHFRYNTMNSWNQSTSYANNIKVYNLGLNKEQEEKLYAMLDTAEFYTYKDITELEKNVELFKKEYPAILKVELDTMINAYPDDRRFKEDLRMYQRLFGKK